MSETDFKRLDMMTDEEIDFLDIPPLGLSEETLRRVIREELQSVH